MYYWTFQHKIVRQIIEEKGIYLPDFSYIFGHDYMEDPYLLALYAFQNNNPSFKMLRGLVFTFDHDINKPFENVDEIREFFTANPFDFSFIKKRDVEYDLNDYELLQLSGYSDIKTIPIDISFFVSLDDCTFYFGEKSVDLVSIINSYGKTPEQIHTMFENWFKGIYSGPHSSYSHLFQHHLPFIGKANIVSVTPANKVINLVH